MAYGLRLKICYQTFTGLNLEFRISKRDYTGAAIERTGCPPAVRIDYGDGAADDFSTIMGSRATVQFYTETAGEFAEFYTADKREYYGELIVVDPAEILPDSRIWRGWIVPQQRNEKLEYKGPVSFVFMDGLGELKYMEFLNTDGNEYTGRVSYTEIITKILTKIEAGLEIHISTQFIPDGISPGANGLKNMFIDQCVYSGKSCAQVLEQILKGCRISQGYISGSGFDSFWAIQDLGALQYLAAQPIENTPATPLYFDRYNSTGGLLSTYSYLPVLVVDDENTYHMEPAGFTNWSAWDYVDFTAVYSNVENVLLNGGFEDGFNNWVPAIALPDPMLEIFTLDNGEHAMKIVGGNDYVTYNTRVIDQTFEGLKESTAGLRLKFSYNIFEGPTGIGEDSQDYVYYGIYMTRDVDGVKFCGRLNWDEATQKIYITLDANWDTLNAWRLYAINVNYVWEVDQFNPKVTPPAKFERASELIDYEMLIDSIPNDCSLTIVFFQYRYYEDADEPRDDYNLLIDNVRLDFIDADLLEYPSESNYRVLNDLRFIETGTEFELLQGSAPADPNKTNIYNSFLTTTESPADLILLYYFAVTGETYTYEDLMARLLMSNHRRPALSVDFQISTFDIFLPIMFLLDSNSSETNLLSFISLSINFDEGIISGNAVAILPFDETSTITSEEGERTAGESKTRPGGVSSHPPLTLAATAAEELTLERASQVLNLDLSAYAKTTALIHSFISTQHTDTPKSYKSLGVSVRQWGLIVSPFSDSVLFTRAFGATAENDGYMWVRHCCPDWSEQAEIITNGGFDYDLSGWTAGAGWAWGAGTGAEHIPGNVETLYQSLTINEHPKKLVFQIFVTAGSVSVQLDSYETFDFTESGTYTRYFSAGTPGTGNFTITPSTDFNGYIDSISIKPQVMIALGGAPLRGLDTNGDASAFEVRYTGDAVYIGLGTGATSTAAANNSIFSPGGFANILTASNIAAVGNNCGASVVNSTGHAFLGYGGDVPDDTHNGYTWINGVLKGYSDLMKFTGNISLFEADAARRITFPTAGATVYGAFMLGQSADINNLIWSPYSMPTTRPSVDNSFIKVDANGAASWAPVNGILPSGAIGDILYNNGTTWTVLNRGTNGQALVLALGLPAWATPAAYIGGSGTINYLPKFTAATTLGNSIIYDNGTKIGIGNTNPQTIVDITGTLNLGLFSSLHTVGCAMQGAANTGIEASLFTASADAGMRAGFSFIKTRGTAASPTAAATGDKVGFFGFKALGSSIQLTALVEATIDGAVSGTTVPIRLSFVTGTSGATRAERLTIKATGLIGINTTGPDRQLEINHATGLNLRLTYNDNNGGALNYCDYLLTSAGAGYIVSSASKFGIINTNPAYPLDVTGDVNTSTMYRVGAVQVFTAPLLSGAAGTAGQFLVSAGASAVPVWSTISYMSNPMNAAGDIICGGTAGAPTRLAKGSDGQILILASGLPTWGALTNAVPYGTMPNGAAGDITYLSGGFWQVLNIGSTGQVLTVSGGLPAWATPAVYMSNPMNAAGDIIYGGTAGAPTRLAKGADGQVLTLSSGLPAWATFSAMSNPMNAAGDIIYGGTAGAPTRLAKGSDGQFLKLVSGAPAWAAITESQWVTSTPGIYYNYYVGIGTTPDSLYSLKTAGSVYISGALKLGNIIDGPGVQSASFYIFNDTLSQYILNPNGTYCPPTLADTGAGSGVIYFSSTAAKLVYKDSGGTVHALY